MSSISAVSSVGSSAYSDARAALVTAQQRLTSDSATQAKVIADDKASVSERQKAVADAQQNNTANTAAASASGRLDVTV